MRLFHNSDCNLKKWKLKIVDDAYFCGDSRKMLQIREQE